MLQQQQETMRRMEEEHAARMEELKQQTAREVEQKMMELKSKQDNEAKLLAAEAEKHKVEKERYSENWKNRKKLQRSPTS